MCLSLMTDNRYLLPRLKSLDCDFSFFSRENGIDFFILFSLVREGGGGDDA